MGDECHEYYGLSCKKTEKVIQEYFHTKHEDYPLIFHPSQLGEESNSDNPLCEGNLEEDLQDI